MVFLSYLDIIRLGVRLSTAPDHSQEPTLRSGDLLCTARRSDLPVSKCDGALGVIVSPCGPGSLASSNGRKGRGREERKKEERSGG